MKKRKIFLGGAILLVITIFLVSAKSFFNKDEKISNLPIAQEFGENKVTINSVKFYEEYLVTNYIIENIKGNSIDMNHMILSANDVKGLNIYGLEGDSVKRKISEDKYEVWQVSSVFGTENEEGFIDLKYEFSDKDRFSNPYKFLDKIRVEKTTDSEIKLDKTIKIENAQFKFKTLTNFDFGSILDFTIETTNKNEELPEYKVELHIDGEVVSCSNMMGRTFSNESEVKKRQLDDLKGLRKDISIEVEKINFAKVEILDDNLKDFELFLVDEKTEKKYRIYKSN